MSFTQVLAPCSFFPLCLPSIFNPLSVLTFIITFSNLSLYFLVLFTFFFPVSHLFFLLAHWRATSILIASIFSFLPFLFSWSEYLYFSGLCSALNLDEEVQYVCFHTIMGSSVVFCNSLRHSLSAIVSQGTRYRANSNTRVAASLIRLLNSRSKDCYWSRI